ncbi:hypothetical protein HLB23_40480 [Nocardia uniformis]|uniref:Glycine zipper domain-containing protein n=1 Tax=Nocardia uniformis TaxID=53432 RepID=A0A849CH09_9NOCA|nr:glycine zipper domain-containing protein [Nocardia uniformis]NNH76057.1 hypothetical protein [Nocardia uniformis]
MTGVDGDGNPVHVDVPATADTVTTFANPDQDNGNTLSQDLSNGSTAIGNVGGAAQGGADKTPQGSHWAPGSGPTLTPEEAARAAKLAKGLTVVSIGMEVGSAVTDLANGKPPGETIGKSGGAIGGGWAGAATGAAIGGAVGGPVGAVIGGGIGAFAGSTYGAKAGKWLGSLFD